jgi:signal transduction histidine kinase
MKLVIFRILMLCLALISTPIWANEVKLPSDEVLASKKLDELYALAANISLDDFDAAKKVIAIALQKARNADDNNAVIECYRSMGYIYEDYARYNEACEEYFKALNTEPKTNAMQFTILSDIAISYRKGGNYQKAKEYHNKTLEFATAVNELEGIEFAYDGLGALYYIAGDYEKAADFYLKSLNCSEKRHSILNQIITLKNLTEIYVSAKHYDLALQSVEKANFLAKKHNNKEAIVKVLICYANTLAELGKTDEAIAKVQESMLFVGNTNDDTEAKVNAFLTLGDIHFKQKDYKSASESYDFCLAEKHFLSDFNLAKLYNDLGNIYLATSELSKAEKIFKQGLAIAEKAQLLSISQTSHQGLFEVFKRKNNVSAALIHLEFSNKLRDSLNSEEKTKRVAELQFRYDLERSEKEIQDLKFRENKFTLIGGLAALSLMIALLAFIVWMRGENNKSLIKKNEEIRQQNKRLEESNEVLRQFAYASAHDLKEPLRNIGSFVSLIQRRFGKDLPEECTEYMGFVTTGVKKMNNLLEDLLAYSTLIMNKEEDREAVNLEEVVKDVKQNLRSVILSRNANVEVKTNLTSVSMSKLHTTQLLQNLVSNGIKFVSERSPNIKIEGKEDSNKVLITVEDNGIGIKKEYSEKVFHLFQRLNKNDARFEGTGVGLAICKNIVEKYNGQIWFESIENQGTKFFIQLPKAA